MNGIRATAFRNVQNFLNIEVGFRRCRGTNVVCLICLANMQSSPVHIRINSYRGDAQLAAGADYPHRDFSSIGNQDFLEHSR